MQNKEREKERSIERRGSWRGPQCDKEEDKAFKKK
jgi:hypothetical protein